METSEIFDGLLSNLKVGATSVMVAARRDEITKALNKDFRSKDGSTENQLMVGSYGRHTAIKGVSDLDLIYILPAGLRSNYNSDTGPRRVLNRVRDVLRRRYPHTAIRVDQCVVRVQFTSSKFKFEVQPVFENDDGSFDYPDTVAESWKITKPRQEIKATKECNDNTSNNMRHLARMVRSWKNTNGVVMGGLLIDTLVHNFFSTTTTYNSAGTGSFDLMTRDFFEFLKDEPKKDYYLALGSLQRVEVKKPFQAKAQKAHDCCLEAIADEGKTSASKKWREVFGNAAPLKASESSRTFDDTEEFIEQKFPVDIQYSLTIDCKVRQRGWTPTSLRKMLRANSRLLANADLDFAITECGVPEPYEVRWKVLNRGDEAERRNEIRGQVIDSNRANGRHEQTSFRGDHMVECYILQDGIVVARDCINVPIRAASATSH